MLALGILVFLLFSASSEVHAKRTVPQVQKSTTSVSKTTTVKSSSKGITTKVKFRSDRRAINVTFTNLSIAASVNYTLSYDAKGIPQGAGGTLQNSATDPTTRELLFGTCSHGVCRYDSNIKNAKLVVTSTLSNGKRVIKVFRLKV